VSNFNGHPKPNALSPHGFVRIETKAGAMFVRASAVRVIVPAGLGTAAVTVEGSPPIITEGMNSEQVASLIAEAMR